MNRQIALRVKELRCGPITHSWRRIAEIIDQEFPDLKGLTFLDGEGNICGIQMEGQELCKEACKFLGEDYQNGEWD